MYFLTTFKWHNFNFNYEKIKFYDLNIKISVDAPTDSKFWESIVNQPDIMKKITQGVHISGEEASSGGKITGSGPKRRGK